MTPPWVASGVSVGHQWDGRPAPGPLAELDFGLSGERFHVCVRAPFFGDPVPPGEGGSTPRLWDFEVVELFLLGAQDHYLELEFGPHGHYLALELRGRRRVVRQGAAQGLQVDYSSQVQGDRWRARASFSARLLPPSLARFNAYAIHGVGAERRYLAYNPCLGPRPDFHSLERFASLSDVAQLGGDSRRSP